MIITPPTPKRRTSRLLRFSLRSLLIAITFGGIALGLWRNSAERQRKIVEAIRAGKGIVFYESIDRRAHSSRPDWRRGLLGIDFWRHPDSVYLAPESPTSQVRYAAGLTKIRVLGLCEVPVTDEHLSLFAGHRRLTGLYLDSTKLSDSGLTHLAAMTDLRSLSLNDTDIGDEGLARLSALTTLEELDLDSTRVTDEGLRHLAKLPELRVLTLRSTKVTDLGMADLIAIQSLKLLHLSGTNVTNAGVARFREKHPPCFVAWDDNK